jgi:prepilin-type processing-associated H-X9-DG protein
LHNSKGNLLFADAHVEQASIWPFVLAASPTPPDAPSLANAGPPDAASNANVGPADATSQDSSPERGQSRSPAPSPRASMANQVKGFAQFDDPVISEENKPGTNSSQKSQAPSVNTPSQSESSTTALDDVPQRPPTRSFTRLMYLGVGTWLLWALIVLLLFVWKKIRERRAEHQKRTAVVNENVD